MNYDILYSGFPAVLEGYNDANWISDSDEIKSTSGFVLLWEVVLLLENHLKKPSLLLLPWSQSL